VQGFRCRSGTRELGKRFPVRGADQPAARAHAGHVTPSLLGSQQQRRILVCDLPRSGSPSPRRPPHDPVTDSQESGRARETAGVTEGGPSTNMGRAPSACGRRGRGATSHAPRSGLRVTSPSGSFAPLRRRSELVQSFPSSAGTRFGELAERCLGTVDPTWGAQREDRRRGASACCLW